MNAVVRVLAGWLVLAVPAIALAAALVGRRPHRARTALRLGVVAAVPGLLALVWLASHHDLRPLARVAVLLAALVPGYALAGWIALRTPGRAAYPSHAAPADAERTADLADRGDRAEAISDRDVA